MIKKGIINWLIIVIMLFIIMLGFLIYGFIFNTINTETTEIFEDYNTSKVIMASGSTAVSAFDIGFAVLFFGLGFLAIWGSSSLLAVSKVFIPIFLLFYFLTVILSVGFANAFIEFAASSPEMIATAAGFPIMTFIFGRFPFFVGLVGLGILVATYAKTKGQQQFSV